MQCMLLRLVADSALRMRRVGAGGPADQLSALRESDLSGMTAVGV